VAPLALPQLRKELAERGRGERGGADSWNSSMLRSESALVSARWKRSVYMARRSSLEGSSGAGTQQGERQHTREHGQGESRSGLELGC